MGPGEMRRLRIAHELWQARSFADYSIETEISCFGCSLGVVRLDVKDGEVVNAVLFSGEELPHNYDLQSFETVEERFAMLNTANKSEYLANVVVRYDAELGFPRRIEMHCISGYLDCGSVITMRLARPLQ